MQTLRNANFLVRFVLLWFALFIGAAIASPLVKPQAMELICSGAGMMKIQVQGDDGSLDPSAKTLDCPLCISADAAPALAKLPPAPMQPLAYALQGISAVILATLPASLPPARGPPAFS